MNVLLVGSNAALAESLIPILARKHRVMTAGRHNADVSIDLEEDFTLPPGIDALINVAAYFDNGTENIIKAYQTNVLGTLKLCLEARRTKVKHIVLISSLSAMIAATGHYYGQYAFTKKHADEGASHYCKENNIPLTILRPSQLYGDSDSFRRNQPFFYHMIDRARNGEDICIYGTRNPLRNYLHADDLSESVALVLEKKTIGTFLCLHPEDISFATIAETAYNVYKRGGRIIFNSEHKDIPDNVFEHDNSLYEKTGRFPMIDIESGITRIKRRLG
ncbi:MAG: NAD(P)-dependent oxidoreductase [Acidobacteriota bacterium]|jgi:nucleoside-diphosphate-sugar epimerase|nr:NAD(P)-dependent oxidoreductase [Acidobacteriota bacterium]